MAKVKKWSDLLSAINKVANKALDEVGKEATNMVKDEIQKQVYDSYTPDWYSRTGQLKESVEVVDKKFSSRGISQIKIGHNFKKINPGSKDDGQYVSVVSGKSVVQSVPNIVHNGKAGAVYKKGYWRDSDWYKSGLHKFAEPRPYMDNVKQKMKDGEYKKLMKKELRKQGIKVK